MVEIRNFIHTDIAATKELIHTTIQTCYPAIYAPDVVDYFLNYHSEEDILRSDSEGHLLVLLYDGIIRATGFLAGHELGGVYVHPQYQRRGFGTAIVERLLELAIDEQLYKVRLDATPLAKPLYDKLGFRLVRFATQMIGNEPLDYFEMEIYLSIYSHGI
jgi:GNAT superfamily N-acetyltransferase